MDTAELRSLVAEGQTEDAINALLALSEKYLFHFNNEIIQLASRYRQLSSEQRNGVLKSDDYRRELRLIDMNTLEIIDQINEVDGNAVRENDASAMEAKIAELIEAYNESNNIENNTSRLRTKHDIAGKLGKYFCTYPAEIEKFLADPSDAVICGICRKIMSGGQYGDMDVLEKLAPNAVGYFAKGNIVNAISKLVNYSKLRMGDENQIRDLLQSLRIESHKPLCKNIERVEAELEFLLED